MKKRFLALFLTVMLIVGMVGTARADVMNGISVDGTYFEVGGGDQSGDGWYWDDGNRALCLDGFYSNDLGFYNCGDVALILVNENQIFSTSQLGLWVEGTTLTIEGDGVLQMSSMALEEAKVKLLDGMVSVMLGEEDWAIRMFNSTLEVSGGKLYARGWKYGLKMEFGSKFSVREDGFVDLGGDTAALVRMERYSTAAPVYSEAMALNGLPVDAELLGGNTGSDRKALTFRAQGGTAGSEVGYVAALAAGEIAVDNVFADEPVITGAAKYATLKGVSVEALPAPGELTWGKIYDLETVELADCPVGLSWKVYGDTDGMFHISLFNETGEGYMLEYLSLDGNDLGVKDARYYFTLDLALELFLSAPRGESYTVEVTNASATGGAEDSAPATTTISDEIVTAWLAELGLERDEATEYDEEDPSIPKEWRAYERGMELMVDDFCVPLTAYALKDPATGYETNYVRVRDIAVWLEMTAAYFNVSWDGAVNLLPGQGYEPNGTELDTPFGGTRRYEFSTAATKVNGAVKEMQAILLKDDAGNGYTYYKLRDLGSALGFKVDWSAEKGVYIETE